MKFSAWQIGYGCLADCVFPRSLYWQHATTALTHGGLERSFQHWQLSNRQYSLPRVLPGWWSSGKIGQLLSGCAARRTYSSHSRIVSIASRCHPPSESAVRYLHVGANGQPVSATGVGSGPSSLHDDTTSGSSCRSDDGISDIKIVDYSTERIIKHELTHSSLYNFLRDEKRPDWAACRWIYVNGLNREVVKNIGDNNNLHRLAIEDVMHRNTPTKVDWYSDHCFIVLSLQRIVNAHQRKTQNKSSGAYTPRLLSDMNSTNSLSQTAVTKEWSKLLHRKNKVMVEQVSIFLTANNTVITIFESSGQAVFAPILARLESPQTIIRSCNDASMLVQAVSDTIVDLALPIGKEFGDAFHELELAVLTKPTISQSKQLYALRSELTLFQDIIAPISSLVRMLRDHHTVLPQMNSQAEPTAKKTPAPQNVASDLISPMTRTYLADVQDRIVVLLSSTRMSIRSAENLTSLMFNTIAARQNESVRQLTLVSIFFLPLTFLTGYFGMNFDPMPVVNNNSDALFWYIAIPFMIASVLFMVTRTAWTRSNLWLRRRGTRAKD